MVGRDREGLPLAGDARAIEAFDRSVDALLRFSPTTLDHLAEARQADPSCAMAAVLSAYLALGSTDPRALDGAEADLELTTAVGLTRREQLHRQAAGAWLEGGAHEASSILEAIAAEHPNDLVALIMGHQLDFLLGDAAGLVRRPERALGSVDPTSPRAGFVHGRLAFGLEESGSYGEALAHAQIAVTSAVDDVWAIHAGAHVCEMRGDPSGGLAHLDAHRPAWQADNWMHNHNAWHRCLFLLAEGRVDEVLDVYDHELRHGGPDELPMPLADAASLLWRLELAGEGVDGRWVGLAQAWAGPLEPGFYAFNDVHAAMALARGGSPGAIDALESGLEEALLASPGDEVLGVGRAVAAGLVAFSRHDDEEAIALLSSTNGHDHIIGGSIAQRDLIGLTVAAAAERSGRLDLARSLASERLARQPRSPAVRRVAERLGVTGT